MPKHGKSLKAMTLSEDGRGDGRWEPMLLLRTDGGLDMGRIKSPAACISTTMLDSVGLSKCKGFALSFRGGLAESIPR